MDWDRVELVARITIIPIVFLAAASGVVYGSLFIMLATPLGKLGGFAVLMASLGGFMFGLWWAFGRPKHWFPPGENTEFNPRR